MKLTLTEYEYGKQNSFEEISFKKLSDLLEKASGFEEHETYHDPIKSYGYSVYMVGNEVYMFTWSKSVGTKDYYTVPVKIRTIDYEI